MVEDFEAKWTIDSRLNRETVVEFCADRGLGVKADAALHMVLSAFLGGEARALDETAELMGARFLEADRSYVVNIVSVLKMTRGLTPAKAMHDISMKLRMLERVHQESQKQARESKDREFVNMRKHGVHVYPEVFKKADLLKVLPGGVAKELKKSSNLDFEADRSIRSAAREPLWYIPAGERPPPWMWRRG